MDKIRVLMIDDHTLFRSGIKLLLQRQEDCEVIGEAGDGSSGVEKAKQLQPDVILLDLHMQGLNGLETIPKLREAIPKAQIIMLTVSEDSDDLLEALRAGARGYLLKNIETEFLVDSIRRASRGESVMSTQMAGKLADSMRQPGIGLASNISPEKLTRREKQIIMRLAKGASNKEIARALEVTESTVKIHVQGILRKLNLTSRVQAAVYAVEHGLVAEQQLPSIREINRSI